MKVYTQSVTEETGREVGGDASCPPSPTADGCRRPYRRPRLEVYGRVADLTLGGSPGIGDSGAGTFTHNPFGGGP